MNFVHCMKQFIDVIESDKVKKIIKNYYKGKTNYREIDEMEN